MHAIVSRELSLPEQCQDEMCFCMWSCEARVAELCVGEGEGFAMICCVWDKTG